MKQQLLEYFKNICRKQFGNELLDVKVSFLLPHQAFVKIVVKTVTSETTAFARDIEQEFAELDNLVNIQIVAG